jgi:hypothetical protein
VFLTDASFEKSEPQTIEYSKAFEFDSAESYSELRYAWIRLARLA